MIKLNYKSIKLPSHTPIIMISDVEDGKKDILCISISGDDFSFVIIGEKKYKLRSGKAEIELSHVPDGISEVAFILGTKRICAAPFFKNDRTLGRVPADSFALKTLEETLLTLYSKLLGAEERIQALEEKITPKNMFKFNGTN